MLVTFHGSGISYHPDHRVIAMALGAAFLGSGRGDWYRESEVTALAPHAASRLYHYTLPRGMYDAIEWRRETYFSPPAEVTTRIDTRAWADTKWRAIEKHATQRYGPPFEAAYKAGLFESETFVRVFPSWPTGAATETDLLGAR